MYHSFIGVFDHVFHVNVEGSKVLERCELVVNQKILLRTVANTQRKQKFFFSFFFLLPSCFFGSSSYTYIGSLKSLLIYFSDDSYPYQDVYVNKSKN